MMVKHGTPFPCFKVSLHISWLQPVQPDNFDDHMGDNDDDDNDNEQDDKDDDDDKEDDDDNDNEQGDDGDDDDNRRPCAGEGMISTMSCEPLRVGATFPVLFH